METHELFELAVREHGPERSDAQPRRAALRDAVLHEGGRRRRRRLLSRISALALLLAGTAVVWSLTGERATTDMTEPERTAHTLRFTEVSNDPTVLDRATAPRSSRTLVVRIDDRELASYLREAGLPPTILRTDDRVVVTGFETE